MSKAIGAAPSLIKPLCAICLAACLMLPSMGCLYAAAGAAGAAGGYMLHEEGYEVQSPVKKQDAEKKTDSETKKEDSSGAK